MSIGCAEAVGFPLLLGEGLDDADTRNSVGQHAGHFGPHAVDLLKAEAQFVTHDVDEPHDHGQRCQRHQRQPWVDRHQNGCRHQDHDHVGSKVQRIKRQENADAVRFVADPRHQIARTFTAKVFQRELEQVVVGCRTQIGADALTHQRQNIGARPTQAPRHQRTGQ